MVLFDSIPKFIFKLFITLLYSLTIPFSAFSQGYFETRYTMPRDLLDEGENKQGSGDLLQFSGRYSYPFSIEKNEKGQIKAWAVTLNCTYSILNNKENARVINPNELLNSSLNISHQRPLSDKWYMIASLGAGVYSSPKDISFQSVLANGAVIFAYKIKNNLDIGVGAGLTNSFGAPIIMPMTFLKWKTTGKYEIDVEAAGQFKASITRLFSNKFKLSLVPYDMDGMSAVMKRDGKYKIYSSMRIRAYLRPEFKIANKSFIYLGIGTEILHNVKISDRSWKGFINSFTGKNERWDFNQSFHIMAGFRYGF